MTKVGIDLSGEYREIEKELNIKPLRINLLVKVICCFLKPGASKVNSGSKEALIDDDDIDSLTNLFENKVNRFTRRVLLKARKNAK